MTSAMVVQGRELSTEDIGLIQGLLVALARIRNPIHGISRLDHCRRLVVPAARVANIEA